MMHRGHDIAPLRNIFGDCQSCIEDDDLPNNSNNLF
jgi:hypothetical protein